MTRSAGTWQLVLPLLPLVQGPLPRLVELGNTGAPILNVEGLNLEVCLVNNSLVVDVVGTGRGAIILMPVESRDMRYCAHNKRVLHLVVLGVLQDNPVQTLDGVEDILRDQLCSLVHGVLVAVQLGCVPHVIQTSH